MRTGKTMLETESEQTVAGRVAVDNPSPLFRRREAATAAAAEKASV